jgi:ribosome-associated toxin RatA of RatAB toxin-antitoxin module
MANISKSARVNYTAMEMYDLVNDVQAYPNYLPMCSAVRLLSRGPDQLRASITLAKGKLKLSFTTENSMREGREIDMKLVEGPFKRLRGIWHFEPLSEGSCETRFRLDFEFSNALLGMAFNGFLKEVAESMVEAFCAQAAKRYGERPKLPQR